MELILRSRTIGYGKNTYDSVLEWIKNNPNYVLSVVSKVPSLYVIIDIDPKMLSDIEDELYRHRITCDYDDRDLKKEMKQKGGKETKWQNSPSKWQIRLPH